MCYVYSNIYTCASLCSCSKSDKSCLFNFMKFKETEPLLSGQVKFVRRAVKARGIESTRLHTKRAKAKDIVVWCNMLLKRAKKNREAGWNYKEKQYNTYYKITFALRQIGFMLLTTQSKHDSLQLNMSKYFGGKALAKLFLVLQYRQKRDCLPYNLLPVSGECLTCRKRCWNQYCFSIM